MPVRQNTAARRRPDAGLTSVDVRPASGRRLLPARWSLWWIGVRFSESVKADVLFSFRSVARISLNSQWIRCLLWAVKATITRYWSPLWTKPQKKTISGITKVNYLEKCLVRGWDIAFSIRLTEQSLPHLYKQKIALLLLVLSYIFGDFFQIISSN